MKKYVVHIWASEGLRGETLLTNRGPSGPNTKNMLFKPVEHFALTQAFKNTCETLPKLKWKTSVKHYLKSNIEKTCETLP